MTVVNTNVAALAAQTSMMKNTRELEDAMAKLSSGQRINTAADDAAGMSIAERLDSQIRGLSQAIRNAQDGQNLIDTVEGASGEIVVALQRLRELAVQSSTDTNSAVDRGFINKEAQNLIAEINRIGSNTQWNGMNVLDGSFVNYRPEHFKLDLYGNSFDEYGSYPEILGYDSTEIEAEYKQAGYLGVNRQKLDSLIIPLGYSIASINNDPSKSIELVKDNIAYKGDRTLEGGINQSLNLKMIYEKSQKDTIDPQIYLKEIKNFSKIDERYEVINLLLNIATHDNTLTSTENKFLDDVAEKLELNQSKYLEIKKIETASLKSVDFGDKADESIFGLSKDMDDKTKCRILRQEYSRWNSQTNNSNKDKRVRAKEMVNLIANLRKQYNC